MIYVMMSLLSISLIYQDAKTEYVHVIPFISYIATLIFWHDATVMHIPLFLVMSLLMMMLKLFEYVKKKQFLGGADMLLILVMSAIFEYQYFLAMMALSSFLTLFIMFMYKKTHMAFLPALILSIWGGIIYETFLS